MILLGIMHIWASNALELTKSIAHTGEATALASSEYGNKLAILDAASSVVELRERKHYEYDEFFPGPYSKPSSSNGAPFFASVHWPMRMDKSWAVQFRVQLGARVHESKTPTRQLFPDAREWGADARLVPAPRGDGQRAHALAAVFPQLCGGEQRAGRCRVDDRRRLGGCDDDDARDRLGRAD